MGDGLTSRVGVVVITLASHARGREFNPRIRYFSFQQTGHRFIFSRRLFISAIYTCTKGNSTTHCEYVATSETISLCSWIVSLSINDRCVFRSHSVLDCESPRQSPPISLPTGRKDVVGTLLEFQKGLDRCHRILDRRFLLVDVCDHRVGRGSGQFRHLLSPQIDHFSKGVI